MDPTAEAVMRIISRLGNGIGLLALAASFALASPGVNAVRAETPSQRDVRAARADAAQCQAGLRRQSHDAETDAFIARLRQQHAAPAPEQAAPTGEAPQRVIVLNNRGYNYGPPPGVAVDGIMAEIEARR